MAFDEVRAQEIARRVLECSPPVRGARIEELCGGDSGMRAYVERCIAIQQAVEAERDSLLNAAHWVNAIGNSTVPMGAAPPRSSSSTLQSPPETIGPYRIIGDPVDGGMGRVYPAEQDNPRRRVALKILRPDKVSARMLKRLEFEAATLGRLQHAGIAQIFNAGTFGSSQGTLPYFAMEFVEGLPLDKYANEHRLDARGRLELVAKICDAAHHAHLRGLVHCDLKPGNILVTQDQQPKILDFGVARETNPSLEHPTLESDLGQIMGTLPYMAPEQIRGNRDLLDARTDVYGLGVILYEILARRLPHEISGRGIIEAARMICEDNPQPLGNVHPGFRGDIQVIVAKAMEKDSARRYGSAAELADDIRRYLTSRPVQARPSTWTYRAAKFSRRHAGWVVGGAIAMLALLSGTFFSVRYARRESIQRQHAENETQRANAREAAERQARALAAESATRAKARQWAAQAELLRNNPALLQQSVQLAAESLRLCPTVEADQTLRRGLGLLVHPFACMKHSNALVVALARPDDPTTREYRNLPEVLLFSPDSEYLAGFNGESVRVWKVSTGMEVLRIHPPLLTLSFNSSGDCVSAVGNNGACGWRTTTGDVVGKVEFSQPASAIAFCADGEMLASAAGRLIRFWKMPGGSALGKITTDAYVRSLAMSGDGKRLAAAAGKIAWVYDVASRQAIRSFAHDGYVEELALSTDGHILATTQGCTMYVWSLQRDGPLTQIEWGSRLTGPLQAVAVSPNGRYAAASGRQGARVVRGESWEQVLSVDAPVEAIAFDNDGTRLAMAGMEGVTVWQCDTGRVIAENRWLRDRVGDYRTLRFASNGEALLVLGVHDVARWPMIPGLNVSLLNDVSTCALSTDRRFWASMGAWGGLTYRSGQARFLAELKPVDLDTSAYSIGFSPDSRCVAIQYGKSVVHSGIGSDGREFYRPELTEEDTQSPRVWRLEDSMELSGSERKQALDGVVFEVNRARLVSGPASGTQSAVSNDGGLRVVITDNVIQVFDAKTSRELTRIAHDDWVNAVAFSADGKKLATACEAHIARVWSTESGREIARAVHDDKVVAVTFSPDGKLGATSCADGTVWVWQAAAGSQAACLPHDNCIDSTSLKFTTSGGHLMVTTSGTVVQGSVMRTGGRQTATMWQTGTWRKEFEYVNESRENLVFSKDGRYLAATLRNHDLCVIETMSDREVLRSQCKRSRSIARRVFFSPRATFAAIASDELPKKGHDGTHVVEIWSLATGRLAVSLSAERSITHVQFSEDDNYVATIHGIFPSTNPATSVWNVSSGRRVARLEHPEPSVGGYFTPDGRTFVTWTRDEFQIWDRQSWNEVNRLTLPKIATMFSFSPDGRYLAVTSGSRRLRDRDYTLHILELPFGKDPIRIPQPEEVNAIAFSRESLVVATAYAQLIPLPTEVSAHVWDARTGREVARVPHTCPIMGVEFSPDGRYLVTGSSDGMVYVWPWRSEEMLDEAGQRLTRNLTPVEWRSLLPDEPYRKTYPNLP